MFYRFKMEAKYKFSIRGVFDLGQFENSLSTKEFLNKILLLYKNINIFHCWNKIGKKSLYDFRSENIFRTPCLFLL